jgi:hypothetical protein
VAARARLSDRALEADDDFSVAVAERERDHVGGPVVREEPAVELADLPVVGQRDRERAGCNAARTGRLGTRGHPGRERREHHARDELRRHLGSTPPDRHEHDRGLHRGLHRGSERVAPRILRIRS